MICAFCNRPLASTQAWFVTNTEDRDPALCWQDSRPERPESCYAIRLALAEAELASVTVATFPDASGLGHLDSLLRKLRETAYRRGLPVSIVLREAHEAIECLGSRLLAVTAERDAEIARLRTHIDRLQESDDALGTIHGICADAGLASGHAVERVRVLAADLAALRAAVLALPETGHAAECPGCCCGFESIYEHALAAARKLAGGA